MERAFFKINDSYDAEKLIMASPEEGQQQRKVHSDSSQWAAGWYLDCVERIEGRRIVFYLGMAEIGKRFVPPGETEKPNQIEPPKGAVPMPEVVKKQKEETPEKHAGRLETMAARNGIEVNDSWRKRPLVARQMDVAEAMRKGNLVGS